MWCLCVTDCATLQGVYHTTHQCFYSRRSLYLALFRLSDDVTGVNELEPWLRNVQVCVCERDVASTKLLVLVG